MKTRERIPTFREALEVEAAQDPQFAEYLERKGEGVFNLPKGGGFKAEDSE